MSVIAEIIERAREEGRREPWKITDVMALAAGYAAIRYNAPPGDCVEDIRSLGRAALEAAEKVRP